MSSKRDLKILFVVGLLFALSCGQKERAMWPHSNENGLNSFANFSRSDLINLADQIPVAKENIRAELINENIRAWYARWYLLSHAEKEIDAVYFIVEPDVYGKAFLGLLLKKLQEGVKVRLLLDTRGSMALAANYLPLTKAGHPYLAALAKAGAKVGLFNAFSKSLEKYLGDALGNIPFDIRKLIASDHDKIMMVDSWQAIVGGRNMATPYLGDPSDHSLIFRDTDILMEGGSIIGSLRTCLDKEFNSDRTSLVKNSLTPGALPKKSLLFFAEAMEKWLKKEDLPQPTTTSEAKYLMELGREQAITGYSNFQPFASAYQTEAKVLDKAAFFQNDNEITNYLLGMFDLAKKEIMIQNPYVIFSEEAKAALQRANDRGVKIIIHTNSPASTDALPAQAFFIDDWLDLAKTMQNLEIWVFPTKKTQLHSKVFTFDQEVSVVGSYNMDYLSEKINSEVMVVYLNNDLTGEITSQIKNIDLANSKKYQIEILPNGEVKIIYGPDSTIQNDLKTKLLLEVLRRMKFLKPIL